MTAAHSVDAVLDPLAAARAGTPCDVPAIDALAINTIRTLSMDAVQAAESGHPGTPMALAPVAYELWQSFLRYDPRDPRWIDRDRFVLSNGHASMLLYAILHLAGVRDPANDRLAVELEDIRRFRQLGSRCAGHPEHGFTPGVETTTGPLGQGLATSVGMALASRFLAARYNRPGYDLFTFRSWAICGDGCLMEGIAGEAASLAGHQRLGNLVWIYDNNRITIEGATRLAYSDDVATRFFGYGWHVLRVSDANDIELLAKAYRAAIGHDRPTLVIVDSHIGWGAPHKQDTAAAHGEPLGKDEVRAAKRNYGWPEDAQFLVPDGVRERFDERVGRRGAADREAWSAMFEGYRRAYPQLALEIDAIIEGRLPEGWDADLPRFAADPKGTATRNAGGKAINAIAKRVPWLLGGSADLAPSTKTLIDGEAGMQPESPGGRNLHFGVREHAMGAVANGLALCGLRAYDASFLVFTDYARGSIRLGALMELPVVHVYTHDSIGLGEDGPTHQPIEHLASLRAMPHLVVHRPMDANETIACFRAAFATERASSLLALSRQNLPIVDRDRYGSAEGAARGAYVLADAPEGRDPALILIGTGAETHLCLAAHERLSSEGIACRVVSMPSWELFSAQPPEYRDMVLPPAVTARVSVEAASTFGWERWIGARGRAIGIDSFGASAPAGDLFRHFGITVDAVVAAAREVLVESSR